MGCFNNHGFYSRLPIEYGDEIVLIPCYFCGDKPETLSTSVIAGLLKPLSFPLFGTYNDYGFIENVKEDFNTQALIKAFGVSNLEELLKLLRLINNARVDGTYKELKQASIKSNSAYSEESKIVVDLMERLNTYNVYETFTQPYSRLTFVIERKDIYNKIIEIQNSIESPFINYKDNLKCWDKLIEFFDKYPKVSQYWNILTLSPIAVDDSSYVHAVNVIDRLKDYTCGASFDTKPIFFNTSIDNKDPEIKRYFFDFLSFLIFVHSNGGYLTESSYGDQDVISRTDKIIKYKEFEIEILEQKFKKYKESEEFEEDDDY